MKPYYQDPTAWIAIAHADMEARYKAKPAKPVPVKTEYEPLPPVDWHHVLASPHKKVRINRAWLFYAQMERAINERGKATTVLRNNGMERHKEELS